MDKTFRAEREAQSGAGEQSASEAPPNILPDVVEEAELMLRSTQSTTVHSMETQVNGLEEAKPARVTGQESDPKVNLKQPDPVDRKEAQSHVNHDADNNIKPVPVMDPRFSKGRSGFQDEATVDEMKIQTMYKMVEDVTVTVNGREIVKKVLYLTNKQANLFDEAAVARCIQALDIGEPKFVIILLPSLGVESQMKIAHTERLKLPRTEYEASTDHSSELEPSDAGIIEKQVLLFMRTCILPLARQTRAIILVGGANDCYLSAALSNVVLAEQARLGKDCPFTVIATVLEFEVHSKASSVKEQTSLSGQLARGSQAWSKRMAVAHRFVTSSSSTMQRCDLTPAASRYLIFEGFDEGPGEDSGVSNAGPRKNFEAVFLQCLTRKLPSIAIQSHAIDMKMQHLAELAARNIPVLALDSSERAITMRKQIPQGGPATILARESDAFPTISVDRLQRIQIADNRVTLQGRLELLEIAQEMLERKWQCLIDRGVYDSLLASTVAFLHSVLRLGAHMDGSAAAGAGVPLHERIRELERLQRSNKDSTQAQVPSELASKAITFIQSRFDALAFFARLSIVEKWLDKHSPDVEHLVEGAKKRRDELRAVCMSIEAAKGFLHSAPAPAEWLALFDFLTSPNTFSGSIHDLDGLKRILGSVAKIDRLPTANSLEALRTLQEAWDHVEVYHQVSNSYKFVSKTTYALLLVIGILITAFSLVDSILGFPSRVGIMTLSFVGTAVAAYVAYTNPAQRWQQLRMAALAIESNIWTFRTRAGPYRATGDLLERNADSLLGATLGEIKAGVLEGADLRSTSFFSRGSSQNLHRQHHSTYAGFGTLETRAESLPRILQRSRRLFGPVGGKGAQVQPVESGELDQDELGGRGHRESTAYQTFSSMREALLDRVRRMAATPAGSAAAADAAQDKADGSVRLDKVVGWLCNHEADSENFAGDSHYAPVQPDAYIRFRVAPALDFYKRRIPLCSRTRNLAQTLLVLGSVAAGALAFVGLSEWAGAVSIVTSAITAYMEFQGTNSKISRYSFTVHALQELVFWWQTLPSLERSVVANVDRLVLTCEDLLQREQHSWRSTSHAVRLLQEHAGGAQHRDRPAATSTQP